MNKQIAELVSEHKKDGFFTRVALTPCMIEAAQEQLGLTIPRQFIDYLNIYGHGGIGGVEILGVGLTGKMLFLEATLTYRKYGLPNNLLMIENVDEWVYCIDCDTNAVVSWSQIDGVRTEYPDFDSFVISEFENAIENL